MIWQMHDFALDLLPIREHSQQNARVIAVAYFAMQNRSAKMNSSAIKKYLTGRTDLGGRTVLLKIPVLQSKTWAERFCHSAGRTNRQNGSAGRTNFWWAERFCRSAGRTDGPQSAPYIYRWLKKRGLNEYLMGRTVLPFCRQTWWALKCTVYIYIDG